MITEDKRDEINCDGIETLSQISQRIHRFLVHGLILCGDNPEDRNPEKVLIEIEGLLIQHDINTKAVENEK